VSRRIDEISELSGPPLPSDKKQWFPNWHLDECAVYDVQSHLPTFINTEEIDVEIAGLGLENSVIYEAREAMLRYVDPGEYVQGVVRVHIRAPNFELHDLFLAFNAYASPPPVPSFSI
jgi:hypothetical protein